MLKKITDPLGIFLIRFLTFDRFHIFGVREENMEMILENVKNKSNTCLSIPYRHHGSDGLRANLEDDTDHNSGLRMIPEDTA